MGKIIMGGVEFKFNNLYKNGIETDEIEAAMFDGNELLTYIEMDTITVINIWAFRSCDNLSTAFFKKLRVIGDEAFAYGGLKTIDITNVVSIGERCFRGSKLETISLNDEITEIPDEAFRECSNLKIIKLPSNLERIGNRAFYRNWNIEKIQIPTTIKSIGSSAFFLSGRGEIILNEEVGIGEEAFWGSYFEKVVIKKITEISKSLFEHASLITGEFENVTLIKDYGFQQCEKLTNIYIPKVKEIGGYAFNNCMNLTISYLPDTVEKIGRASFAFTKIAVTKLPKKINTIPNSCFYGCSSLNNLTLGDIGYPIKLIENFAFEQCTNLKKLTIYTTGGQALAGAPWGATNAVITYLPA